MGNINQQRPDLVKRGWTQEMWDAREAESGLHKAFSTDSQFEQDWIKGATNYQKTSLQYNQNKGKDPNQAALDAKQASYEAQLDEFYKHMTAPLDDNDPDVIEIRQSSSRTAGDEAKKRGLQGGIVASEAGRRAGLGTMALRSGRRELGLRALAMKGSNVANLQGLDLQRRGLAAGLAEQQYQSEKDSAGGLGGIIGGIGGGIAGGVGAYFTGDPSLIGTGIQAGSSIGAGAAAGSVQRNRNPGYYGGGS